MASDRVNVAIPKDLHEKHSKIARLLGKDIQEATTEAIANWNKSNAHKAQKKSAELVES